MFPYCFAGRTLLARRNDVGGHGQSKGGSQVLKTTRIACYGILGACSEFCTSYKEVEI